MKVNWEMILWLELFIFVVLIALWLVYAFYKLLEVFTDYV